MLFFTDQNSHPEKKPKKRKVCQLHLKHESYIDLFITNAKNQNVPNSSKQNLKLAFGFKYSEKCLNVNRITKQITIKESSTKSALEITIINS